LEIAERRRAEQVLDEHQDLQRNLQSEITDFIAPALLENLDEIILELFDFIDYEDSEELI
jgi:hypothetical protein